VIGRTLIGGSALSAVLALAGCGGGSTVAASHATVVAVAAPAPAKPAKRADPVALPSSGCNPRAAPEHQITRRKWLSGVIITEYYPVPERWFNGQSVRAPGAGSRHRVDWLYSASGVSMEGDGVDLAGRHMHIANLGSVGWVNASGRTTVPPRCGVRWTRGAPAWRSGGWRNRAGRVTYPLAAGGWSNGTGHWVGDYGGATFLPGSSLPLSYYRSVAVDPALIPHGSRIYIPAYRNLSGGWFVAQDTGGAIIGRHIDVYRPPTAQAFGSGRLLLNERVYVIPPGA
jgi:3D (Asp-Asp-Asp) domain-containing protein